MDVLSLAKELVQSAAEQAASYSIGQSALRYIDRGLWIIEKCARWAVPPPLDQDAPQPELIRPLPWVFFLFMLISLRVTRESLSLLNLVLGKPPLRSADVVMFIQSKRRYLRTLKYQGNRIIRARTQRSHNREPWYGGLQSLFEFTMCFRRSYSYGNNNTTRVSNNDEIMVVKRKRSREPASPVATTSENTMDRLIEKMMVELDAASDDDSSFTLTNARSDCTESEEDTVERNDSAPTSSNSNDTIKDVSNLEEESPVKEVAKPTNNTETNESDVANPPKNTETNENDVAKPPTKTETNEIYVGKPPKNTKTKESHVAKSPPKLDNTKANNTSPVKVENGQSFTSSTPEAKKPEKKDKSELSETEPKIEEIKVNKVIMEKSPKAEAQNFLLSERCSPQKNDRSPKKIANGRTSNKKRDLHTHARSSDNVGISATDERI